MKFTAKIICCGVALVWMCGVAAEEEAAAQPSTQQTSPVPTAGVTAAADSSAVTSDDLVVPTPPAPRITVQAHREKVDRAKIEKRLEDKSARTRKRTAEAEKDVAERAAKAKQNQTSGAPQ